MEKTITKPVTISGKIITPPVLSSSPQTQPEDLIIDITSDNGHFTVTMNSREVNRLKGRFGKGPDFEKWVGMRVRDLLNGFAGGM